MKSYKRLLGLLALAFAIGALGTLATLGRAQTAYPPLTTTWLTVFSDTFTTTLPAWTHLDDTGGKYHWGITPYTRTLGTLTVADSGFWAVGGGTLGSAQSWPTDTYPSQMWTWAVAGPFTPTQKTWDMQVRFWLDNRLASGDKVFVGLSTDGVNFKGIELTATFTVPQEVVWGTREYIASPVYVGLYFSSSDANVATGPLIDDLLLAFNYGSTTYLPFVRRDPPPTATPTLTPSPTPTLTPSPPPPSSYTDHFDDPASGWHVGIAQRFNRWPPPDFPNQRWEDVADISYHAGNYRFYIPLTWHGGGAVDSWFVWPAEKAPMPADFYPLPARYCVEARAKIANSWDDYNPWWAHWGLVFGADADMTELYTFQVNANHSFAVLQLHNYFYPGNVQPLDGEEVNVEIPLLPWSKDDLGALIETAEYNTLKAVVISNTVKIYVDGVYLGLAPIPDMPRANVGLVGGSWEATPVELWFDYFTYDPLCPEAQP